MSEEPTRPPLNRRTLLGVSGAAAAGALLLNEAVAQNPAANVQDRGADVRIRALRAHRVAHKVYVQIETNVKVTGWGEVSALEPTAAEALTRSLFELLDGENPTRIEHLWQKLFRAHRDMRGGPFMVHTIAGIDMALWDLTGKLWGVPVHRLLGGPCRDKIRVYPTAKAHKVPPHGIYDHSGNPVEINRMVNAIRETRKRVGQDGTVMFDAHCAVPPATLIQLAAAIQPYDILFIEEPAVPGNIEVFKRLKEAIRIPLATGERDRTIWEMIAYLQNRCIDVLQPDVAHTGGITQMKKIATLAEAYHVPLAPHCTTSPLGATASLHVAASIPLLLIHETAPGAIQWGEAFARKTWTIDKDGYASLPEGPGLGVQIDEKAMAKVAAEPGRKFQWPIMRLRDGSVADY
ncbi:MAG TPA: mandelate racemase/muconate lactonizing enzyme family protein [Gemmataceae bacterium]|nr:mandelate racemase/muconate lactonizing enzyme family protein [Gemmataceae bacterium]